VTNGRLDAPALIQFNVRSGVISVVLIVDRPLPVYPGERTSSVVDDRDRFRETLKPSCDLLPDGLFDLPDEADQELAHQSMQ
jgi:hypothetical protein